MKRALLAVALCLCSSAYAEVFRTINDNPPVPASNIEIGNKTDSNGITSTLRVLSTDGTRLILRIDEQGDLVLRWGATVDFNGLTFPNAGKRKGYLLIFVDGEPMLLPLYGMPTESASTTTEQK
jgi:hypothetical protein